MKKILKRFWGILTMLGLTIILIACNNGNDWQSTDGSHITSTTFVPFRNCDTGFDIPEQDAVQLYFLNDEVIPYIDVTTYVELISSVLRISIEDFTYTEDAIIIEYNPLVYQYMFFENEVDPLKDTDLTLRMEINFTSEQVILSSYLFFLFQGKTIENPETETIQITNVLIEEGSEVVIPFKDYDINFTIQTNKTDRLYLVPFHVATLLFTNSTLYRTYYNGDEIIVGGRCIYYDTIRNSSFNGTNIPIEIREMSFRLFSIAFDYFSAVRQARNVESYYDLLQNQLVSLTTASSEEYYTELVKLLYRVDDLHSDLPANGYYASNPSESIHTYPSWFRPHRAAYWEMWNDYITKFTEKYGDINNRPTVTLLDNETIAVIHLYQFTSATDEDMLSYLQSLPSTVKNVVIDVSMNAGGSVNAIFRVLGYMTNQPIRFKNGIALNDSSITYTVEVSQAAYNYNWYIKTSSLTYSAGNILALIAKENDIATIIGEKSMGGASVVESILLPCGFSHTISGNYTFYSDNGSSEFGVDVDIPMENHWDDVELIDIINQ